MSGEMLFGFAIGFATGGVVMLALYLYHSERYLRWRFERFKEGRRRRE